MREWPVRSKENSKNIRRHRYKKQQYLQSWTRMSKEATMTHPPSWDPNPASEIMAVAQSIADNLLWCLTSDLLEICPLKYSRKLFPGGVSVDFHYKAGNLAALQVLMVILHCKIQTQLQDHKAAQGREELWYKVLSWPLIIVHSFGYLASRCIFFYTHLNFCTHPFLKWEGRWPLYPSLDMLITSPIQS